MSARPMRVSPHTSSTIVAAYVAVYEEKGTVAFRDERGKQFTEYREGWTEV